MTATSHTGGRLIAAVLLCASPLLASLACTGEPGDRTVRIGIRHSRFDPAALSVRAGETVTFRLDNGDPIAHEFIIGTEAEQARHERGHDETHDGTPGAASLDAGETDTITYTFEKPGELVFACHLPGHYAYGMRGTITVRSP
ncbi:MAG TPA: cupredoxin domain-containing protein [Actinomycetota bacterium]